MKLTESISEPPQRNCSASFNAFAKATIEYGIFRSLQDRKSQSSANCTRVTWTPPTCIYFKVTLHDLCIPASIIDEL